MTMANLKANVNQFGHNLYLCGCLLLSLRNSANRKKRLCCVTIKEFVELTLRALAKLYSDERLGQRPHFAEES